MVAQAAPTHAGATEIARMVPGVAIILAIEILLVPRLARYRAVSAEPASSGRLRLRRRRCRRRHRRHRRQLGLGRRLGLGLGLGRRLGCCSCRPEFELSASPSCAGGGAATTERERRRTAIGGGGSSGRGAERKRRLLPSLWRREAEPTAARLGPGLTHSRRRRHKSILRFQRGFHFPGVLLAAPLTLVPVFGVAPGERKHALHAHDLVRARAGASFPQHRILPGVLFLAHDAGHLSGGAAGALLRGCGWVALPLELHELQRPQPPGVGRHGARLLCIYTPAPVAQVWLPGDRSRGQGFLLRHRQGEARAAAAAGELDVLHIYGCAHSSWPARPPHAAAAADSVNRPAVFQYSVLCQPGGYICRSAGGHM